jgi:hypothetical protein
MEMDHDFYSDFPVVTPFSPNTEIIGHKNPEPMLCSDVLPRRKDFFPEVCLRLHVAWRFPLERDDGFAAIANVAFVPPPAGDSSLWGHARTLVRAERAPPLLFALKSGKKGSRFFYLNSEVSVI